MMLAAMMMPGANALAAPDDTGTASASSEIAVVEPLQLVKTGDLDFGTIITRSTAGTVTVDAASSNCTTTGGIVHVGSCAAATFSGYGTRNQLVILRAQNPTPLTGPGAPMTLSNFQFHGNPDLALVLQLFGLQVMRINPSTGIFDFRVGGRLNVNANQAPGTYTGSFEVRIDYF